MFFHCCLDGWLCWSPFQMFISTMFLDYDWERWHKSIHIYLMQFLSFMVSSKVQECFGRHHDRHNGSRCQRGWSCTGSSRSLSAHNLCHPAKNKRSMSHNGRRSALVGPSTAHAWYIKEVETIFSILKCLMQSRKDRRSRVVWLLF